MFTFSRLGNLGRFGNQLFQIAATMGMAAKHGVDCLFPTWEHAALFRTVIPQAPAVPAADIVVEQKSARFTDLDISVDPTCVIDLVGYFQSERFFSHCACTIRAAFQPCTEISTALHAMYDAMLARAPHCIVVVRRGDYALYPHVHPLQPPEFYARAMAEFEDDTCFLVTSDDIAWCQAHIRGKYVSYLPQPGWVHNFFLGTLCRHAIISNTTYGWWLAWLNAHADKRVIAPKHWSGPSSINRDARDLLPPDWIKM